MTGNTARKKILMVLFPRTILRTHSPYNRDIRVVDAWGGRKLLVNGSPQSGPFIASLWQKAFFAFGISGQEKIGSVAVFGLGGGTVIELLSRFYPGARITVVEIDRVMIGIARAYFAIDRIPRVRILRADAETWSLRRRFDLMIVDLFFGREIPQFVSRASFYRRLCTMLSMGGSLVVNYLREGAYHAQSDRLERILTARFSVVRDFPIANNRFFFCRP